MNALRNAFDRPPSCVSHWRTCLESGVTNLPTAGSTVRTADSPASTRVGYPITDLFHAGTRPINPSGVGCRPVRKRLATDVIQPEDVQWHTAVR